MQNDIANPVTSAISPYYLSPPSGMTMSTFIANIVIGAGSYDNNLPYGLPPLSVHGVSDVMASGTYNSNSLAAGVLIGAGASYDLSDLRFYVNSQGRAAPGLEQPVPANYFH